MTHSDLEALLADARGRLAAAGAPRERLGMLREPRRILGVGRAPRIVPVGEAWHLGTLLLTDDGLAATGEIVRARHEAIRGVTAENQRRRLDLAAAARRGGFAEGETVHLGWRALDVGRPDASAPLVVVDDAVHVRWSAAGAPMPLARYLDERIALAIDPPAGAS